MSADPWYLALEPTLSDVEARMLLAVQERACNADGWTHPCRDGVPRVQYKARGNWPIVPIKPLSLAESAALTWLLLDGYISNRGVTQQGLNYLRGTK